MQPSPTYHPDPMSPSTAPGADTGGLAAGAGGASPGRPVRRGRIVAAVIAAALAAAGAAVYAVDASARHAVCTDVQDALLPDATSWRGAAADLRARSRFLWFDHDLRSSARTLAAALDRMAALEPTVDAGTRSPTTATKLLVAAGTVNADARATQQACGLPVTGVFAP
jgi:hypothetical protein